MFNLLSFRFTCSQFPTTRYRVRNGIGPNQRGAAIAFFPWSNSYYNLTKAIQRLKRIFHPFKECFGNQ
jgi:hypothetical protein